MLDVADYEAFKESHLVEIEKRSHKLSEEGKLFIYKKEGVRYTAYTTIDGYPTIGAGHLILPTERHLLHKTLTPEEVDRLFWTDIAIFEYNLNRYLKTDLNQNQTDAVLSLMFNIGSINFKNSSVLRHINAKEHTKAADAFLMWCKVRGRTIPALFKRRQEEKAVYIKPKTQYEMKPPPTDGD